MDIKELAALAAVERFGSFAAAARGENCPLSTLSNRVSRAERELGFPVFERGASVSLTAAGAEIMPLVRDILSADSSMFNTVSALLGRGEDTLAVGLPPLLGDIGDGALISSFIAENRGVRLVSVIRSQPEMLRLLLDYSLGCAFFLIIGENGPARAVLEPFRSDAYIVETLRESSDMFIGLPESDPLASRGSVDIASLRSRRFIFNKWHDDLGYRSSRGPLFFEFLGENRRDFDIALEDFVNRDYIYSLVASGAGVLPQAFPDKYPVPGVRFLPLEGWSRVSSVVFVARRYGSRTLRAFTEHVLSSAVGKKPF